VRTELTANKVAFASLRQRLGLLMSWTALSERAQQAVRTRVAPYERHICPNTRP